MKQILVNLAIIAVMLGAALFFSLHVEEWYREALTKGMSGEDGPLSAQDAQDYRAYLALKEQGQLDAQGRYQDEEVLAGRGDRARVTFAQNAYLPFTYYRDAERTQQIDPNDGYLAGGESVYASDPRVDNPYSNCYAFSGFRVWQIAEDGERHEIRAGGEDPHLVLTVPADSANAEFVIEPLGAYVPRTLHLSDSYDDGKGETRELNGRWSVEGGESVTGLTMQVNPLGTYRVVYDFGDYKRDYYVEKTEPKAFFVDDEDGTVTFAETSASDRLDSYAVKLHRYVDVRLENNAAGLMTNMSNVVKSLLVNGEQVAAQNVKEQSIGKLKCGDGIVVQVAKGYHLLSNDLIFSGSAVPVNGGYEYVLSVPETHKTEIALSIIREQDVMGAYAPRQLEHGSITLRNAKNKLITAGDSVSGDETVTVTISAQAGYYVGGKNVKNGVYSASMKYADYVRDVDKLLTANPIKKIYQVTLETADEHGRCEYRLDGKAVGGVTAVREEQELTLTYTLTDEAYRIVRKTGAVGTILDAIHSRTESVSIPITRQLDGATVRREDYIQIMKAEEGEK